MFSANPIVKNMIAKRGLSSAAAAVSARSATMKPLPYELGDLEPVISGQIMDLHYGKHHRTYVKNLNDLTEKAQEAAARNDIKSYCQHLSGIKFNGGGHVNHELFWDNMAPVSNGGGCRPDVGSDLETLISAEFGSIDQFEQYFNTTTATIQGSGWGWLAYNKSTGSVQYLKTANQDMVADFGPHFVPLLGVDVWEHAYYLDYKNARPMYLKNIWKIINWQKAEERLAAAKE